MAGKTVARGTLILLVISYVGFAVILQVNRDLERSRIANLTPASQSDRLIYTFPQEAPIKDQILGSTSNGQLFWKAQAPPVLRYARLRCDNIYNKDDGHWYGWAIDVRRRLTRGRRQYATTEIDDSTIDATARLYGIKPLGLNWHGRLSLLLVDIHSHNEYDGMRLLRAMRHITAPLLFSELKKQGAELQ